ncbi:tRNA dihydrouridine synthase DusB [Candidatus Xenohaliotis californiensis]
MPKMLPIKIGNIQIQHPIILAPMSNVTDISFRNLATKMGAEMTISEMVASRAMVEHCQKTLNRIKKDNNSSANMAVQIVGSDPDLMSEAAKIIAYTGAKIIDINLGCPCRKITGTLAGSALMKDELLVAKIIKKISKAVSIPITVKMRLGWDKNNLNSPKIARIAEESGVQMITVHGRTRAQMYNGQSNWTAIKQVKQAVKIPVIANGDIGNATDIYNALKSSEADGVMIGRASYGKPWLVGQLIDEIFKNKPSKPPNVEKLYNIVIEHYESLLHQYGTNVGMKCARKHIGWYSAGMPQSTAFRQKINQCNDYLLVHKMIKEFFSDVQN